MSVTLYGKKENEFDSQIEYHAKMHTIPFSLLKGFVSVESAFNPKAYRDEPHIKDGSRGLMQILYRTAKSVGFSGKPEELFEPDRNIHWGATFLKTLLDRDGYSVLDAIAAYNMGHPRPASKTTTIIKKIYGTPEADWAYANEPYVRRVVANAAFYEAKRTGQEKTAEKIKAIIKKKLPSPHHIFFSTQGEYSKGRRVITLGTFDWGRCSGPEE